MVEGIRVGLDERLLDDADALAEAARRGTRLLTVGMPDSPLAEVAIQTGGVHVPVPAAITPAARASRMALWALLTPVLVAAYELGLVETSPVLLGRVAERLDTH